MKALSIRQPWANAIIFHGKDIENRKWNTKFRGNFLVHAAQTIDYKAPKWVWDLTGKDFQTGGIIGVVELTGVVTSCPSKWFQGPYGFVLKDPVAIPFREYKGKLNFFNVEG